jgi:hypothetical protein
MSSEPPVQPNPPAVKPGEAIAIARRLKHVFDLVDDILHGDQVGRIWAVHGVVGGSAPVVESLETKDELCELISTLRAKQNAKPHEELYIHMFFGQQWSVQKGRNWKLWDGSTLIPVTGGDVTPFLDRSGSLREEKDPDELLPRQPDAEEQPAPPTAVDDAPAPDEDVEPELPVMGEESAPPGQDPTVE